MTTKKNETEGDMWYAIMLDREDSDWGFGSHDLEEAKQICLDQKAKYPEAYIAVIEEGDDPVCIEEIEVE